MCWHDPWIYCYIVPFAIPVIVVTAQQILNLELGIVRHVEEFEREAQPAPLGIRRIEADNSKNTITSVIGPLEIAHQLLVFLTR